VHYTVTLEEKENYILNKLIYIKEIWWVYVDCICLRMHYDACSLNTVMNIPTLLKGWNSFCMFYQPLKGSTHGINNTFQSITYSVFLDNSAQNLCAF
jgi:hypothetical protein